MVRVRHVRRPQLGHNCFELRLSPSMVEIVTSKADDAVMASQLTSFWQRRHPARDAILMIYLFSKLLRIENPGLMGTFHGHCSCPLHLPATVRGKTAQREGRTLRGILHQRVNEFHRICNYGIAQKYEARPALPRTTLACIDLRIIGNHHAMPAIRPCRNRTGTPEYVCHAVPRSNHARKQRSSSSSPLSFNSDASRQL
jgi:hypothetical protein